VKITVKAILAARDYCRHIRSSILYAFYPTLIQLGVKGAGLRELQDFRHNRSRDPEDLGTALGSGARAKRRPKA
jgi:hypothetical protein